VTPAEQAVAALRDRRSRAAEAGIDAVGNPSLFTLTAAKAVAEAVGVAIRVRVDDEIVRAATNVSSIVLTKQALEAAFAAAGFEVEE